MQIPKELSEQSVIPTIIKGYKVFSEAKAMILITEVQGS
jgi:hypothetical protein